MKDKNLKDDTNMKSTTSYRIDTQWIRRAILLAFFDVLVIFAAYFMALFLRFDLSFDHIPHEYLIGYESLIFPYALCCLVVFYIFRLYHSIWRFASVVELQRIIFAMGVCAVISLVYQELWFVRMPISFWVIGWVLMFCGNLATRFGYRFLRSTKSLIEQKKGDETDRIMVIGAGSAGRMIVSELVSSSHIRVHVCCVIDDNRTKLGRYLQGVPIVGNRYSIPEMVDKYKVNRIIYAIPTTNAKNRKEILTICKDTGCKVQAVPGIYQIVNGKVSVSQLRNVEIEDLLGRDQVIVDNAGIHEFIAGHVVMVTGGGGSIGSELCRQIAAERPKQLIIFDIYENNAYSIEQELKRHMPEVNLVTLIGSVRNTSRVNSVLRKYKPEVIFHAAAHKHVPLMENSPNEAIKNNVFGTYKLAKAAADNGVKRFVLISTDKAVNPTNIMGASKRLCEMIVQMMNRSSTTEFAAVRFGNVLGSNGSVIPLFKKQIAEGGPVTVTDPNIVRYFMTIPEAVSLVLQAGIYARGGEIFVLDMGDPVRIDDMARNLIKLSGYEPDVDIPIVYTGLRPGEKLYEEILMDEEGLTSTPNHLIHIGKPIEMDDARFEKQLEDLERACLSEADDIREVVADIVPTYHPWSGQANA